MHIVDFALEDGESVRIHYDDENREVRKDFADAAGKSGTSIFYKYSDTADTFECKWVSDGITRHCYRGRIQHGEAVDIEEIDGVQW